MSLRVLPLTKVQQYTSLTKVMQMKHSTWENSISIKIPKNSYKYIKSARWYFHCPSCNEHHFSLHAHLKSKLLQVSFLLYLLDVTYCKTKLCTGNTRINTIYTANTIHVSNCLSNLHNMGIWNTWMFTSILVKRMGIKITKLIHRIYEIGGKRISWACSISPLGDLRKTVSKLKSPAVMEMIFSIAVAGGENGDRYKK